jgi:hypothetical protein
MLRCPHCKKNSAFWEDGTAWKVKPTLCPKCHAEMAHKTTRTKTAITLTYTCPSCSHSYKDKMDLRDKKEKPDPDFDKDRAHFCLHDKEFRDRLFKMKHDFEGLAQLGKEMKELADTNMGGGKPYDTMVQLVAELDEIPPLKSKRTQQNSPSLARMSVG